MQQRLPVFAGGLLLVNAFPFPAAALHKGKALQP